MSILKSQIELTLHLLRLHREEKGTQTSSPDTPNPGPAENTAILPPPVTSEDLYTFPELSLEPGDPDAIFY